MSVSINNCPKCSMAVLPDTAICPDCGYVLNDSRAKQLRDIEQSRAGELQAAEMEDPCPKCGTMVRSGMVRCWDCGTFMRPDIAEKYVKLQTTPQPIIYSDSNESDEFLPARRGEDEIDINDPNTYSVSDSDFELDYDSGDSAEGGDFELSPQQGAVVPTPPAAPVPPAAATPAAPVEAAPAEAAPVDAEAAAAAPAKPETAAAKNGTTAEAATEPATPNSEDKPAEDNTAASSKEASADDLLNVAISEEVETQKRRRNRKRNRIKNATGILVYCPRGHQIEVPMRFAGRKGKCPKCKSPFLVPRPDKKVEEVKEKKIEITWLKDMCLHHVDPTTLKLKPGSLQTAFGDIDILIDEDGLHLITLVARKKLAKTADKQKNPVREEMSAHLLESLPVKTLPVAERELISADSVREQLSVAQPTPLPHESMFAGVAVFGEGRIALRLPTKEGSPMRFLSMELNRFIEFAGHLQKTLSIEDFGKDTGIPLATEYETYKCHYSSVSVKGLQKLQYYEVDPEVELELTGHKCDCCGIAVSEESRKKEKLGGANGRGLARAKCPKCSGKFGKTSLHQIKEPEKSDEETDK